MGTNANINIWLLTTLGSSSLAMPFDLPYNKVQYENVSGIMFDKHDSTNATAKKTTEVEVILQFSERLLSNSHSIDEEFQVIVNKRFWDLI